MSIFNLISRSAASNNGRTWLQKPIRGLSISPLKRASWVHLTNAATACDYLAKQALVQKVGWPCSIGCAQCSSAAGTAGGEVELHLHARSADAHPEMLFDGADSVTGEPGDGQPGCELRRFEQIHPWQCMR